MRKEFNDETRMAARTPCFADLDKKADELLAEAKKKEEEQKKLASQHRSAKRKKENAVKPDEELAADTIEDLE